MVLSTGGDGAVAEPDHSVRDSVIEEMAHYAEAECGCPMPIVVGETKHAYGLRLLKALAAEMRTLKGGNKRASFKHLVAKTKETPTQEG